MEWNGMEARRWNKLISGPACLTRDLHPALAVALHGDPDRDGHSQMRCWVCAYLTTRQKVMKC